MARKYNHRRVDRAQFFDLMRRAGFSVDDFMYLTGRRREQLEHFMNKTRNDYIPTMAEVLILEVAAICPRVILDQMFNIAARYDAGPKQKEETNA